MVFSEDLGFGEDKYAFFKDDKLIFGKRKSIYVEANDDAVDMPLFEGKRYYTGEEALMEDSSNIINIIDYKNHEKYAPLSLYGTLNFLKIKPESISTLYLGLSLSQKEYASSFVKRLSKFKINSDVYDFTDKIKLVPQGVSAKYAIDYYYYQKEHEQSYAIIDIGQLTVDVATVIAGKIRSENAQGSSNEGIIKIVQRIQEHIAKTFSEIISVKEAQEVLMTKKYNLFGEYDLSKEIDIFKSEYSKYIASVLKQKYRNIFKKYPKIYIVGGGGYYIDIKTLQKESGVLDGVIIIPEHSEYYNTIGGLLLSIPK